MKLVLIEDVPNLGALGDSVIVKDGYARNYLIPNGKAKFATKQNIEKIKSLEETLLEKDDE